VLFFRHADTMDEPRDRSSRLGNRPGQPNISPRGREQSAAIGARLRALGIPVQLRVLAGPVSRARDTAEHAFGAANVVVTESLLADDVSGPRLDGVIAEQRRLFREPVPAAANRALVGHRTPGIMVFGEPVAGRAFAEGGALVIAPGGVQGTLLGIVELVSFPGGRVPRLPVGVEPLRALQTARLMPIGGFASSGNGQMYLPPLRSRCSALAAAISSGRLIRSTAVLAITFATCTMPLCA
jgi:phosphohistidine phosphatase SixA